MLIKCKECEGKVSDKAAACPHCGAPVASSTKTVKPNNPALARANARANARSNARSKTYAGLFAAIGFIGAILFTIFYGQGYRGISIAAEAVNAGHAAFGDNRSAFMMVILTMGMYAIPFTVGAALIGMMVKK